MKCYVCFDKIDNSVSCSENCENKICNDCVSMLLEIHDSERKEAVKSFTLPVCVCKSEYTISCFKDPDHVNKYIILCNDYIKYNIAFNIEKVEKEHQKQIVKIVKKENNDTINKIRQAKLLYIENNYPEAVKHVIKIALKSKMNSVKSSNLKKISKTNKYVKCFDPFCKGSVTSMGSCLECFKSFCLKCDRILETNHICNNDNIESKKYIEGLSECPTCKVPVEKTHGCDYITCAICRTNFSYTKKHVTTNGNHTNFVIKLKNNDFNDVLDNLKYNTRNHKVISSFLGIYTERIDKSKIKNPIDYEKFILANRQINDLLAIKRLIYEEFEKTKTVSHETVIKIQKKYNL